MLIPCIDLQGGQAVQLVHGKRRELAVADLDGLLHSFRKFAWIHLIDLDAAMRVGDNGKRIRKLCDAARRNYKMKIRVGGGIRTVSRAVELVRQGANQVIIGSAAFRKGSVNAGFFRRLLQKIPRHRVIVALDATRGRVVIHGWKSSLPLTPESVMARLEPYCAGFLCTDVDREGTMRGANLGWFKSLRSVTHHPIIAAGGVSSHREIAALARLGMDAAVGMALYKRRLR
ncbi:MAG TPA: HisA/HisF-related TIM barrel protein [Candidatus Acidoferrales bacterium]|nr:HisA/HisF-related TIM barrel protein [Candidatus Acidoferrales bacterium]